MTELHCTGCSKLVPATHKCTAKRSTLIDLKSMVKHKASASGAIKEVIDRVTRIEAKLDIILAAMDRKKRG